MDQYQSHFKKVNLYILNPEYFGYTHRIRIPKLFTQAVTVISVTNMTITCPICRENENNSLFHSWKIRAKGQIPLRTQKNLQIQTAKNEYIKEFKLTDDRYESAWRRGNVPA